MVELLAPVGNLVMLKTAIDSGCDSVYLGIKGFNMRANAKNFELNQLKSIVNKCHKNGVKVYLTLNSIVYQDELKKLEENFKVIKESNVDAVICWDLSVINLCKKFSVDFHISTQASISNYESLKFYHELGAKCVVLARECTLKQIKKIKKKILKDKLDIKIEAFVHGAMCVSVSGRCFISEHLYGKSANRGDCIQPCRRKYRAVDIETENELEIGNGYILSPKDLCCIRFVDKLIDTGIDIFKIEGRMRSEEYVKVTVSNYRKAIEACDKGKFSKKLSLKLEKELSSVYNRGFSTGFLFGKPINEYTDSYGSKSKVKKVYVGRIRNVYNKINVFELKVENEKLKVGDLIMIQGPTTGVIEEKIVSIQKNSKNVKECVKKDLVGIKISSKVRVNDKVFINF